MSRNPCSSNSEHSHRALSTSASAVALPYLASSRGSSEPALTPMRIGTLASDAARAISATLSSNFLMLPGFTRTAAQPASMAAKTYRGWKWMSAISGIWDFFAMAGRASTSSCDGTATRTIWHPAAVSSAICWSVALTSAVKVVVIDWTLIGAPPPTGIEPTMICRVCRRGASGCGDAVGMPRLTDVNANSPEDRDRVDDVRGDGQEDEDAEDRYDGERNRGQLHVVDPARVGLAPAGGDPRPYLFKPGDRDVTAVHRQQREQVEHAVEQVQHREQQQEGRPQPRLRQLTADPAGAHHAETFWVLLAGALGSSDGRVTEASSTGTTTVSPLRSTVTFALPAGVVRIAVRSSS